MNKQNMILAVIVGLIVVLLLGGILLRVSSNPEQGDVPPPEPSIESVNFIDEGVTEEPPIATPVVIDIDETIEVVSEDFSDLPALDMSNVRESMMGPYLRRIPLEDRVDIPFEVVFLERPSDIEVAMVGGEGVEELVNEEGMTLYLVETNMNLPTIFSQDNSFVRVNLGRDARVRPDNLGEKLFAHLPYASEQVVIEVMTKGANDALIEELVSMSSWHLDYQQSAAEQFDGFIFLETNPLLVMEISDMPEVVHIYYFRERPNETKG